jgi:TnpA family transposase
LRTGKVSPKKVKLGWDTFLRFVASIRLPPEKDCKGLAVLPTSCMRPHEIGKLLRTIFLCDYFSKPEFRREMHALLDRGESVHQLQRAVHQGRIGTQRGRRRDELWAISGAHTLLTNAIIAWNTMKMQQVVDDWKARRH